MRRRKRPRLFSFSRDVELDHFRGVVSDPSDQRLLEAMIDGFIEIGRTHEICDEALAPFVDGARHPLAQLRGLAFTRLSVLTHYFAEACEAFGVLCADPDPEVRRFAASALANTPPAFGTEWLDRLLADPEWTVRKAAAQTAGAVPWPGLAEIVAGHEGAEGDARVRVALSLARAFQTQSPAEG